MRQKIGTVGSESETIIIDLDYADEAEAIQKITVLKGLVEKAKSYSNLEKRENLYNPIDEILNL